MPVLQKPLGWLQRYLYNIEQGPLPFPQPVITINHDWPLEYRAFTNAFNTIVGTQSVNLYLPAPQQEKHGIVRYLSVLGANLAGDLAQLQIVDPAGIATLIEHQTGSVAGGFIMLGGPFIQGPGAFSCPVAIPGVYIPPGWLLRLNYTSAVAATPFTVQGVVWERVRSYPLVP